MKICHNKTCGLQIKLWSQRSLCIPIILSKCKMERNKATRREPITLRQAAPELYLVGKAGQNFRRPAESTVNTMSGAVSKKENLMYKGMTKIYLRASTLTPLKDDLRCWGKNKKCSMQKVNSFIIPRRILVPGPHKKELGVPVANPAERKGETEMREKIKGTLGAIWCCCRPKSRYVLSISTS